jgi:gamma-glutamyl-gamma-aminobutyrate hydrolase PuuD
MNIDHTSKLYERCAKALLPLSLIVVIACGPSEKFSQPLEEIFFAEPAVSADLVKVGIKDEIDETGMAEFFDEGKEARIFAGEFKDQPDPDFSLIEGTKIPNQEDIESLLMYLRKHVDSIDAESPDTELIKAKLFMNDEGKIDFNALLKKFGFEPIFKDVSFSIERMTYNRAKGVPGIQPIRYVSALKNLILRDAQFDSVKFENLDLSGSQLSNVEFKDSTMSRSLCMGCTFDNVSINNSTAKDADFSFSKGNLRFDGSKFSYFKATDSDYDSLSFNGGTLTNSVFVNSKDVTLNTVTVFNNVFDHKTEEDAPLKNIGIVFKNSFPGGTAYKIHERIRASEQQPIKIEYGLEGVIDPEAIQNEVIVLYDKMKEAEDDLRYSKANRMLREFENDPESYPQLLKIRSMMQGYVNSLDALIIPGGLDLEPFFEDDNVTAKGFYADQRARLKGKLDIVAETFPIRTMLELFLIRQAKGKGIPLLLICRGAHLYNAIRNGSIIANLPDIYDNVDFNTHRREIVKADDLSELDEQSRIIQLFNKEGSDHVVVYGNHHQAIDPDDLGDGIRTLLVWKMPDGSEIPYGLYDETYAPGAWLTQFHPEVKETMGGLMARMLSNFNSEIFDSFFELLMPAETTTTKLEQREPME